jgi:hypothetical protein
MENPLPLLSGLLPVALLTAQFASLTQANSRKFLVSPNAIVEWSSRCASFLPMADPMLSL